MTGVQTSPPRRRGTTVRSFLSFGGLSGLGWLLDLSLLLLLVGTFGWPNYLANLLSSLVAAGTVFLVSRRFIFSAAEGKVPHRLAAYLVFTVCVVLIASAGLVLVSNVVEQETARRAVSISPAAAAAIAKIIITPPQLVLNFLLSRYLNERFLER